MNLLVLSKSTERRALEAEEGGGGSNIVSSGPKTKKSVSSSSRRQQQPPPVSKHPQQTRPKKVPLVLLASVDGTVTAVKANTGSKIWSIELGGPLLSSWENRTIFNGSMIIPNTDGSLYVTTSTGRVQRVPVSVQELVSASPFMADDGSLYVAKKVSQFFVVDRSTGKVLRQVDADIEDMLEDESKITGEKTSSRHNQILLGRYEFQVKCMHPETHEISWKASLSYFPNVAALDGGADEEVLPPSILLLHLHFPTSFAFYYLILP
jgi:outer membrane protein assembly factor BamB